MTGKNQLTIVLTALAFVAFWPAAGPLGATEAPFATNYTVDGDFDGARSVYAADVDSDGDLDVLGAAGDAEDITWWENTAGDGDPDGVCLPDGSNVVLRHTLTTPVIRIGGVEVPAENVLFSGSSPASVGVNEIVFTMPGGVPAGDAVSLTVEMDGVVSKEVTMAVE